MEILRYGLLLYAFCGFFVAGGLFFRKDSSGSTYLSFFVVLLAAEMLEFLYSTSQIRAIFPQFFLLNYFPAGLLYGPLLLLHFKQLFDRELHKLDLLHVVPCLAMIVHLLPIYQMTGISRFDYSQMYFMERIMPLNYLRAAHQSFYGAWLLYFSYANFQNVALNKRYYALLVCSIYFLSTVLISWYTMFAESWRGDFIFYYFAVSSIIFVIAYLLYSDASFLKTLSKKYLTSSINEQLMKEIKEKLESAMDKDKVFLRGDLSLKALSDQLEIKPHQLSQTLSELINEGFNDYINKKRVTHAQELLLNQDFDHYKIEAIGKESGFNNKVTFNNAFKKFSGLTPSAYRDEKRSLQAS